MNVRSSIERAGFQTTRWRPVLKSAVYDQTIREKRGCTRNVSVRTASTFTAALRARRNETTARSRERSLFGLTVVSRRRSPANGVPPFPTRKSRSRGARAGAGEGLAWAAAEQTRTNRTSAEER